MSKPATVNQSVDIGTDVASFYLFHPDDLAHCADYPIAWTGYDWACSREFEAGTLIAFATGSDGSYQLRLTTGDLTDAERAKETGSWEFGYTVRHGRVFVDNSDFLPGEEARPFQKAPAAQWVDVPNGDYRVMVHPIEREDLTLPDYVVRFEPVKEPLRVAHSSSLPILEPLKEYPPAAQQGIAANDLPKRDDTPLASTYPLLVVPGASVLPNGSTSVETTEAIYQAVTDNDKRLLNDEGDIYVVLAGTDTVPFVGTVAWINGSSQAAGDAPRLGMQGKRLVTVTQVTPGKPLPVAHVEAITRPVEDASEKDVTALQAAFDAYAERHAKGKNKISAFDRARVAAMRAGDAVTTALVELVAMPTEKRFALLSASDAERAKALLPLMAK